MAFMTSPYFFRPSVLQQTRAGETTDRDNRVIVELGTEKSRSTNNNRRCFFSKRASKQNNSPGRSLTPRSKKSKGSTQPSRTSSDHARQGQFNDVATDLALGTLHFATRKHDRTINLRSHRRGYRRLLINSKENSSNILSARSGPIRTTLL